MKIVAKIKLLPSAEQSAMLMSTMLRANECANWLSGEAWGIKVFQYFALQKTHYHPAREKFALNSQLTVRVFAKVTDAYKLDKKAPRTFGSKTAIAYDDRNLRFRTDGTVNLWTVGGRQSMGYAAGPRQKELLKSRQGESDLIHHRGKWYLGVTCNVVEPSLALVDDWIGCDLGIANILTDSDGGSHSGSGINNVRHRHRRLRSKLQPKCTQGTRRKLRKLSGRERRFASDTNHRISKQIVAVAKGTNRGIALEDLRGVSERVTVRRYYRATLRSWAFFQLRQFIAYKAALAGVPVAIIDPRNTSRQCAECGHIDKRNRLSQSEFRCIACGHTANADLNAAQNIRCRASISRPNVTQNTEVTS